PVDRNREKAQQQIPCPIEDVGQRNEPLNQQISERGRQIREVLVVVEKGKSQPNRLQPWIGRILARLQRLDRLSQSKEMKHVVVQPWNPDRGFRVQLVQVEADGKGEDEVCEEAFDDPLPLGQRTLSR